MQPVISGIPSIKDRHLNESVLLQRMMIKIKDSWASDVMTYVRVAVEKSSSNAMGSRVGAEVIFFIHFIL